MIIPGLFVKKNKKSKRRRAARKEEEEMEKNEKKKRPNCRKRRKFAARLSGEKQTSKVKELSEKEEEHKEKQPVQKEKQREKKDNKKKEKLCYTVHEELDKYILLYGGLEVHWPYWLVIEDIDIRKGTKKKKDPQVGKDSSEEEAPQVQYSTVQLAVADTPML